MHFPSIETAFPKRHVKKRPIFHHVYIIKKLFERQQIIQEDTFPLSKLCHGLLLTLDYHVVWIRQWENDVLILFLLSKFHAGEVSEKMVWPSSDRNVELPSGRIIGPAYMYALLLVLVILVGRSLFICCFCVFQLGSKNRAAGT